MMIQLLGRFSRLSSTVPSHVEILTVAGTIDERVADVLVTKLEDIGKTMKQSGTEESYVDAFNVSDDDWLADLAAVTESFVEGSYV